MQPDLENLKKRIGDSRDLVERLISKLPGYSDYVQKGEMYEADRVVRSFLSERMLKFKNIIDQIVKDISKKGDLGSLPEIDSLNMLLERIHKKCAFADYGKSSTMSHVNVSQEDQDKLLEFDWRMIGKSDELEPEISKLQEVAPDSMTDEIARVRGLLEDFEREFERRKNVILEVI